LELEGAGSVTAYLGPPCHAFQCREPATQRALFRLTVAPYGGTEERELCEAHSREAIDSERRPFRMTPLAAWSKHQHKLAQEAEEEQHKLTMEAQQRWEL
jgi:hypothetical protein